MKRTSEIIVNAVLLVAAGSAYGQSAITPPGAGTSMDPYQISELGHLVWMGDTVGSSADRYYIMTADIDASETAGWNDAGTGADVLEGFQPIGTDSYLHQDAMSFRGIFDAQEHTISGMVINRRTTTYVGLFGAVRQHGQVRNLGMVGIAVTGGWGVAGLVGVNYAGTVWNCYATGAVTGGTVVGGLIGYNDGTVSSCYATGAVTGVDYVGGSVGYNEGAVSSCYATGAVTGDSSVAGLVGYSDGTVSQCYATGAVAGTRNYGGGLLGYNDGTVSECYATGAVTGSHYVGGSVGHNEGAVSSCYATGAVAGTGYVGGLVGFSFYNGTVSNCYATGAGTGDWAVGGLVGRNYGAVSNSYWDMQSSGLGTSSAGTGKSTAEMKQQATFAGWDFAAIWGIGENVTCPWLRSLTVDSDGDGIPDPQDNCADSDLTATIVINGFDTGVTNKPLGNGCTMADEIAKLADGARNHGAFTSAVAKLTNAWVKAGLITGADKGRIQSAAARTPKSKNGR